MSQIPKERFLPEIHPRSKRHEDKWKDVNFESFQPKHKSEIMESLSIQSDLSLEDSLRKSLSLITTFKSHENNIKEQSTRFQMLEVNEFFIQMSEELRYLKSNLIDKKQCEETIFDKTHFKNVKVQNLFRRIQKTESKINESEVEMNVVKDERKVIHDEIRSLISDSMEIKRKNIENFPYYLLKGNEVKDEMKIQAGEDKSVKSKKPRSKGNFIDRNIQLAKNRTMYNSKCQLTDEEKLQLAKLLELEEKVENPKKVFKSYQEMVDNYNLQSVSLNLPTEQNEDNEEEEEDENAFKLCKKDSKNLKDLNRQLDEIEKEKVNVESIVDLTDDKPWRKQIMEKKLCTIDKNLIQLSNERLEENDLDKSEFVLDNDKIEDIRKEYYESLEEVKSSLKDEDI